MATNDPELVDDLIHLNGLDADTGEPLLPAQDRASLLSVLSEERGLLSASERTKLKNLAQRAAQQSLGLPVGIQPQNVAQAGWGVIFPTNSDPAIAAALRPLLDHRQAHVAPKRYRELVYNGEVDAPAFLKKYKVGVGTVLPNKVPYYLLLVGSPAEIPFAFEEGLAAEYAVGRLALETPADYERYARSVVDYEMAANVLPRKAVRYWAPRHRLDPSTILSADHLVKPLTEGRPDTDDDFGWEPPALQQGFAQELFWGANATLPNLADCLVGGAPPALLFTASHGRGFKTIDPRQRSEQGALISQEYAGSGPVPLNVCLSAGDVADSAHVHGMIGFFFACYSAGTPATDRYFHKGGTPLPIAAEPFVAALPNRLLSHPNGGALACIGHVERAWGYSIKTDGAGAQILPFRNAVLRLLLGEPVGHALLDLRQRATILSDALLSKLESRLVANSESIRALADTWVERNDARGYGVLGDPAVQIRVSAFGS